MIQEVGEFSYRQISGPLNSQSSHQLKEAHPYCQCSPLGRYYQLIRAGRQAGIYVPSQPSRTILVTKAKEELPAWPTG